MSETTAPRPQDDLFRHVNADWLRSTPIDADKPTASTFVTLNEQARTAVREIVEGLARDAVVSAQAAPPCDDDAKLGALYRDFMDTAAVEQAGTRPLEPLLQQIAALGSTTEVARHWGWSLRHGLAAPLALDVDADMDQPREHALFLWQSGLGLPDRDYYREAQHAELLEAYRAHVARSLELAGIQDHQRVAEQAVELEAALAEVHWSREESRDFLRIHNPTNWSALADEHPGLHLDQVAESLALDPEVAQHVLNAQPSALQGLEELLDSLPLQQWRSWCTWALLRSLQPYLGEALVAERFAFHERTLQGTQEQKPRWKRGIALVEGIAGEVVGRHYVEHHLPASSLARVEAMVELILQAYRRSIEGLDWMGEQTRQEALRKLDAFRPKLGHPRHWRDHDALEVVPGDLVGNVLRGGRFNTNRELERLGQPVDDDQWMMTPQTVNAYYHGLRNEIVFPAAILQPPFFDPEADEVTNLGAIGSVIGHEIGHGFDDQGSTCDGDGRLRDWWTEDDRAAFAERTAALVAQFDALVPLQLEGDDPQPHVNGRFTIGENIGDLGGLGIAVKAWLMSEEAELASDEQRAEALRRLFTGYARVWRCKHRDEAARRRLVVDPHSPNEFRCNQIARNLDAFHEAFATTPSDAMWMEPGERVTIW